MDHAHIVQAGDLDRYAPTRDSQAVIPELVYLLVKQSCSDLLICRIPYGDAVNQPGSDGLVETAAGYAEFVPKGKSYWEIGTGANPQTKATEDFRKRTAEIGDQERADSTFVFVTPRSGSGDWSEPEQTKWLERRQDQGWKLIRVIDGVKVADWLREYPAIGKWMAKKMNLSARLGGLSTATEHWEDLLSDCAASDPPLPPKLFTVGRSSACEALTDLFEGRTEALSFFAESLLDVADFVSAFLAGLHIDTARSYGNRCLYINDEQAWRSIVETRQPHILLADPRLGLETEEGAPLRTLARRNRHAVIVPISGAWSGYSPEIIKLRSPSQSQIESVLKESGYTDIRARELGRAGGDRLSALRRHLQGYGDLPPYATWENATLIAQAGLVGKWDGSKTADRSALEMLLGKGYGEWIEALRPYSRRSDSPLIQNDEKWRFVARGEAWNSLGSHITDDDLQRFRETAVCVLKERDPIFDLPKDERFAAPIRGKVFSYSQLIRKGFAETLALIGTRPKALTSCSSGKPESTALIVVRDLLEKASWERWASLDSVMPLLAEAAPDEFLRCVESVLVDLDNAPFHMLFAEEGGAVAGLNYMSGILWALETLAWSPDYLPRVSIILADIASFDPGGTWANRPSNSLADIFLPWHVQTTAPFGKRKAAVEAIINGQPRVGWKLLLALLPHNHGSTSGCHRPIWRDLIPRDWKHDILVTEYWEQITAYTELAIRLAKRDSAKLLELIQRMSDLPEAANESLLEHLASVEVISMPEADRLPLWENLGALVRRHRKFSDKDWAMAVHLVDKIEGTAKALAPTSPAFTYHHLFGGRDFDLYNEKGNFDEQHKRLEEARQAAISEILNNGGIEATLQFAVNVAAPHEVGRALGEIASNEIESFILPTQLDAKEEAIAQAIAGFIWTRYWKLKGDWVDAVLGRGWSVEHRAKFLIRLPFKEEIWERVSSSLGPSHESIYWENVVVNPYGPDRDLTIAIEMLLKYGREGAAVMCAARTTDDESIFNASLATRALLAVLGSKSGIKEMRNFETVELIKQLQKSDTADKDALFQIEWSFLPWLDRFSSGSPVTLEKKLASEPEFFSEVVGLVFRSNKVEEEKLIEANERQKHLAANAYKLLTEWKHCPGTQDDGSFSKEKFDAWINDARRLTEESGHAEVAQIQIGHVLTQAPPDPDGLWIHNAVASALNFRDTGEMRSGFTTQLFNNRGVHGFTHGQEERRLASQNRLKAEALDSRGYTRFAAAMREFADQYERQAEREAAKD